MKKEKYLPEGAYDLYLEGLKAISEMKGLTLEEARDFALADAKKTHGHEHVHLIKAAYKWLKDEKK